MRPDSHDRRDPASGLAYDNVFLRKGSVAAFVAAVRRYDAAAPDSPEAARAASDIEELLPAVGALGVFQVFAPISERARALLKSLDSKLPF